MSKTIAISIPKGGVGKTTTAVNLSASLAMLEKKTLLIDFDPAGACSLHFNLTQNNIKGGVLDVLSFSKSIKDVIHKTDFEYLDLIPSNVVDYEAEEKLNRLTTNPLLLRNIIGQEGFFYDYIIMDCPPYLKGTTNLALVAADSVIIPIKSAYFSIDALKKLVKHMNWVRKNYNKGLKIEGILNTIYEQRTRASGMAEMTVFKLIGNYVFNTSIPKTTKFVESTFHGKPIITFDAASTGSLAYLNLAEEIIIRNKICPVIALEKETNLIKLEEEATGDSSLFNNDPNPFNINTNIKFRIQDKCRVKLTVMNIHREEIGVIIDENLSPGVYKYNYTPNGLPDGVYYYRLDAGDFNDTQKMIYSNQ